MDVKYDSSWFNLSEALEEIVILSTNAYFGWKGIITLITPNFLDGLAHIEVKFDGVKDPVGFFPDQLRLIQDFGKGGARWNSRKEQE